MKLTDTEYREVGQLARKDAEAHLRDAAQHFIGSDFHSDVDFNKWWRIADDLTLGKVTRKATYHNLRALGYTGNRPNKNPPVRLVAFYTAILYKLKEEFGDSAVKLTGPRNDMTFRGFKKGNALLAARFNELVVKLQTELLAIK